MLGDYDISRTPIQPQIPESVSIKKKKEAVKGISPKPQESAPESGDFLDSVATNLKTVLENLTGAKSSRKEGRKAADFGPKTLSKGKERLESFQKAKDIAKEKDVRFHVWKAFAQLPRPVVKLLTAIALNQTDLKHKDALHRYPPELIPKLPAKLFTDLPGHFLPILTSDQVAKLSADQFKAMGPKIVEIAPQNLQALNERGLKHYLAACSWESPHDKQIQEIFEQLENWKDYNDDQKLIVKNRVILGLWYSASRNPGANFDDPKWIALGLLTLSKLDPVPSEIKTLYDPTALSLIDTACYRNNSRMISLFIERLKIAVPDQAIPLLFDACLRYNPRADTALNPLFLPYINKMLTNGETLLNKAVKENNPVFVSLLMAQGGSPDFKDAKGQTAVDLALAENKWSLLKILKGNSFADMVAQNLLNVSSGDLETYLWKAFLNSDSRDVIHVIDKAMDLDKSAEKRQKFQDIKKAFQENGTVIARFRDPDSQERMFYDYLNKGTGYQSYGEQQIGFAQKRNAVYTATLQNLKQNPQMGLEDILNSLSKAREAASDFKLWRDRGPEVAKGKAYTEMGGKYSRLETLPLDILAKQAESHLSDLIVPTPKGYQVMHRLDDGTELALTQLEILEGAGQWTHTDCQNLTKLFPAMEKLFEEIKVESQQHKPMTPELEKKIALLYWMTCQAMPFARGSSQYALELHRLCYEMCGYRCTPPSNQYILPDTVALAMPFDVYYPKYYRESFEGQPQKMA